MKVEGSLVIGILARDCAESIRSNMARVEKLGQFFSDYHVVVYENDSKDGTTELLQEWAANNERVIAISEETNELTIPKRSSQHPRPGKGVHRIERMARFRNRILDEVQQRWAPDYFAFLDIDVESFCPELIAQAVLNAPADWGALFANGHIRLTHSDGTESTPPFQYDSYALLQNGIDYRQTGNWCVSKHFHKITAWTTDRLVQEHDYLPVASAFGGIGIFRWQAIAGLQYAVEQTEKMKALNACFCEHVPFNSRIAAQGYGLYIARDMEVVYSHVPNNANAFFKYGKQKYMSKLLLKFKNDYPISILREND